MAVQNGNWVSGPLPPTPIATESLAVLTNTGPTLVTVASAQASATIQPGQTTVLPVQANGSVAVQPVGAAASGAVPALAFSCGVLG